MNPRALLFGAFKTMRHHSFFSFQFHQGAALILSLGGSVAGALGQLPRAYHWAATHLDTFELVVGGTFALTFVAYWLFVGLFEWARQVPEFCLPRNEPPMRTSWASTLRCVLWNQLAVGNMVAMCLYPVQCWRGIRTSVETLPSVGRIIWDLLLCLCVEEVLFYSIHRALHHPRVYWIHKIHHEWSAPRGFVALYAHPLEHVLSNLLPVMVGPLLCGAHLATLWIWLLLATFNTVQVHSGVLLPFLPPPTFHDDHHQYPIYNYGVVGVMDKVFNTNKKNHAFAWTLVSFLRLL